MVPCLFALLGIILFYFRRVFMIDMHYDLLSILYYCYLRNDFSYINDLQKYFNNNNVTGLIANLYFMSEEEMQTEMPNTTIDVVKMFQISTELFKKFFPNIDVVFSIEGCDYIKDVSELKKLKDLGLGSILLVWNNKNKYGSGAHAKGGLTASGEEFIRAAIDLGITIDMAHMNEETFWDTINILRKIKMEGMHPKVIVSHSDVNDLFNHPRNITKDQIRALKEFDAIMGLVSYSLFLTDHDEEIDVLKNKYLEHIKYAVNILDINHVGVATDDMGYDKALFNKPYKKIIFPYKNLKEELENLLLKEYSREDVEKILKLNVKNKLFGKEDKND